MKRPLLLIAAALLALAPEASADLSHYAGSYECQTLERWRPVADDFRGQKVRVAKSGQGRLKVSWTENGKPRTLTTPVLKQKKEGGHTLYEIISKPFVASFYKGSNKSRNFNLTHDTKEDSVKMSCAGGYDAKPSAAENASDQGAFFGTYQCAMFTRSAPKMWTSQKLRVRVARAGKGAKLSWKEKRPHSLKVPSLKRSAAHSNAGWTYNKSSTNPFANTSVNLYLGMDKKHHLQFQKSNKKESYQAMCSK